MFITTAAAVGVAVGAAFSASASASRQRSAIVAISGLFAVAVAVVSAATGSAMPESLASAISCRFQSRLAGESGILEFRALFWRFRRGSWASLAWASCRLPNRPCRIFLGVPSRAATALSIYLDCGLSKRFPSSAATTTSVYIKVPPPPFVYRVEVKNIFSNLFFSCKLYYQLTTLEMCLKHISSPISNWASHFDIGHSCFQISIFGRTWFLETPSNCLSVISIRVKYLYDTWDVVLTHL